MASGDAVAGRTGATATGATATGASVSDPARVADVAASTSATASVPGGPAGPPGQRDESAPASNVFSTATPEGAGSPDNAVVDRTAAVVGRTPGPFAPRQLARLDEALTLSSRETGLDFSVWVGALDEPTREHAERLHAGLGTRAKTGVLVAVSPGQRVLHIVTGEQSARRLPDRSCSLAALSMRASLSLGDLVGGIVNGLRMLSDQAGRPNR